MSRVCIETGSRLTMPRELRRDLKIGDELVVRRSGPGKYLLLSERHIRAALGRTAGLWQGRTDQPTDGAQWVRRLRKGQRQRRLGVTGRARH